MDDRPFRSEARRALVPHKQSRSISKPSAVQIQLARLSESGKAIAGAIPDPVKAASRHSVRIGGWCAGIVFVLIFASATLLYARLLAGPISFAFLVPSLQRQLNSQLRDYSFHIGDAILRLAGGWRLEFRLADVRLMGADNQEIATAPLAAIGISEPSLLRLSIAADQIKLIGPKLLLYNFPGKGLALTPSQALPAPSSGPEGWAAAEEPAGSAARVTAPTQEPREIAGLRQLAQQGLSNRRNSVSFNAAPLLARLFSALENRGGASSSLHRVGVQDAIVYFASERGVATWRLADFHIDLDEEKRESALRGELTLQHDDMAWRASFRAVNRPESKRYAVTASIEDIVPHAIWRSFPALEPLKLIDLPLSGVGRFEISHEGDVLGGDADITFGAGQFFAPFDEKHPASVDGGILKLAYDKDNDALLIKPLELHWDDSVFRIAGAVAHRVDPKTNQAVWAVELDGKGTRLGAPQFGASPVALDALKLSASYQAATGTVVLKEFLVKGSGGAMTVSGQAADVASGGPVNLTGVVSSMPISFLKVAWPAFVANGARDWVGSNVPTGRIAGGSFSVNLSASELAALDKDGDIPESSVSMRLALSGLQIYHIKGLPPISTKDSVARVAGRHFVYDIPGDARIDVPSGKSIAFSDGQLAIDDLRPHFPNAAIKFKATGEAGAVLELLDQPPLGYVRAVGFKPNLVTGQATAAFKIGFPLLKELHFKQMTLSGKSRVSDLKSNGLPGGLTLNGGAINFDVSEAAVSANGDLKVNNVPVTLAWQRIFDAPPERQPALRIASILNERSRDELGLNINHIVKGDLPVALAIAMQRDGPPKAFMEANLTNSDVYLTAIGWRKPPGQKASVTMEVGQRQDNYLVLDNFAMTGDGLNVSGRVLFNEKRRIAAFNFPEFSTNALTKLAIAGELTPQNVLKVQAKGPSYDGRQFFRSILTAGKISDNQPAPLKDEPGLDLNVEIETVFGYYDTSLKSVVLDAKRRGGKLTYMEVAGRLNGERPVAVHIDQKPGRPRILVSDATDAGAAFRLAGFYSAVRGGTMNLQVNLDGAGGADKSGVLEVRGFAVVGDQVVGRVVSQAEKERARYKPESRNAAQQVNSGEPLVFDRLVVPFSIGASQFSVHDASINGSLLGATMRGNVDFGRDTIALSGTYVPLYGVNGLLQGVPVLGTILTGRDNEGVFGITFAVQGKTSSPDVIVNPMSALAPGFLRQIFEFDNRPPDTLQLPQSTQVQGTQVHR